MRRTAKVITAPATEPVTLGEAKAWTKVDGSEEDPLLTSLITAAREAAEQFLRRCLISQSVRLTLDLERSGLDLGEGVYDLPVSALYGGLPSVIELPKAPVQSITSVTTYDTADTSAVYSSANYRLNSDGNRLVLGSSATWPSNLRPVGACEVVYVAGYGATGSSVPQSIRNAMLMHIKAMYDGRDTCDMPENCQRLLRPFRVLDSLAHG